MMPDQSAVSINPVRMGAVLPPQIGQHHRVTWRVDEIVSSDRLREIVSTAHTMLGVVAFRPLTDQQVRPHTMFMMEISSNYNPMEVNEVVDEFYAAVNQTYLAEQEKQQQRTTALNFSSR